MTASPTYSLVIPVYNEEKAIPHLMERLQPAVAQLDGAVEILFVNDGSADRSKALLEEVAGADRRVKVINLSRNFGHQIAITAGMEHAAGDAIIVMDADLQDPPEIIGEMARHWRSGFDVVYAQRVERQGESTFKRATASAFYKLVNALSDTAIPLDTGDFRLISRRARDAFLRMPERERFVRGMFAWIGFRQCAVPFVRAPRVAGATKYPVARMIRLAVNGIISFSDVPLRLVVYLGLAVTVFAVVFGVWTVIQRLAGADYVPGWASLFVAIVLLTGANMTMLGVIGLYVGRIYTQVKDRPMYLIDSVVSGPASGEGEPTNQ
jgi:dolichol-phosphate mannosyltransferase